MLRVTQWDPKVQGYDGEPPCTTGELEWLMATKSSVQKRRQSRRRAAAVLVPTIAGVFIAGTAFAYWSTSGAGTATASTGTSQSVTVTQTGVIPSDMAPGGSTQPIAFAINNPKSTPQRIASVTISIDSITQTTGGAAATGCTSSDFAIVQPTVINANLATGTTTYDPSGATIRMLETNVNQDACKNVTVNLAFAAA